jgi:hypothetical protein
MLHVIESGETAWAVGASEGQLVIYQRDDEGWIELHTEEGDELDEQASGLLDALFEGQSSNGATSTIAEPSSRRDEDDDQDEEDEQDEGDEGEGEEDEGEEPARPRRSRSGASTSSRRKR